MKPTLFLAAALAASAVSVNAQNIAPGVEPGPTKPQPADDTKPVVEAPDDSGKTDFERRRIAAPKITTENEFVTLAAKGGTYEVKIAQLAGRKSDDAQIKELAGMLVKDHTAVNEELKTIAGELNVNLSDLKDEKGEKRFEKLDAKSGKDFDKAFVADMSESHSRSIALFEAARNIAKSPKLTAFIEKTLPVIKSHAAKLDLMNDTPGDPQPEPNPPTPPDSPDVPGKKPSSN